MRILTIVLGLLAGIAAGVAVLAVSPWRYFEQPRGLDGDLPTRLHVAGAVHRGSNAGPAALLGLDSAGTAGFSDPVLRHARITVAILESEVPGAPALAVKLSAASPENDLLRGRLSALSVWNIMWPGHGSLFLAGADDYLPELADSLRSAASGAGFKPMAERYLLSRPLPGGRFHGVVGASGRLATLAGHYREWDKPQAGGTVIELEVRAD